MRARDFLNVFAIYFFAMGLAFAASSHKVDSNKPNSNKKSPAPFRGKSIVCDETKPQIIKVSFGRLTFLNFPSAPKDILPGEMVFDFKQIKNELAIKSLLPGARTNVGIYLQDRRCSFDLMTVSGVGDDVLFVRDPLDSQVEVKFHE